MGNIFSALVSACLSLLHPRMWMLMIWPMALAILLWTLIAFFFGAQSVSWLQNYLQTSVVAEWTSQWFSIAPIAAAVGWIAVLVLFIPLVLITASLIIGIFGVSTMIDHVAKREYPSLERKHGVGIAAMTANAVFALIVFLILSLITLPLWFIPLLWPIIPILLFAYFNQRMFRFDALSEHASDEEMHCIFAQHGRDMFLLAIVLSLIAHVPVLGFFTPVLAGLAFIHFCLARLAEMRTA